jgi:purine-binding chemotaxis protein CheW
MSENSAQTMSNQYLTFKLGDEMFALDVAQVREILDFTTITKVPRSPSFMRGVINVRGSVVPVVDLRVKFGMMPTKNTIDTRIVVVEVLAENEVMVIGTLADAVHNVIDITPDQIEDAPRVATRYDTDFIKGIGKLQEDFIIILDINRVFSIDEMADVHPVAAENREGQNKRAA